jgi:superfamily II DNA or RNA helicase
MAEEALDIKSLNTLIMATPKTDVTQAVGRILREKHGQPLIIDVVDSHDTFGRQWAKRKKYYLSQKYSIVQSTNSIYPKCEPLKEKERKSKCLI